MFSYNAFIKVKNPLSVQLSFLFSYFIGEWSEVTREIVNNIDFCQTWKTAAKMNENNTKVDPERPSLSQYFSQTASTSLGASFFDEISSGSGPAMMTSIQESASSQDLFESANAPLNSTSTCPPTQTTATVTSTVITQESVYKPLASTGTVPETSTFTQVTGNTGSEPRDKMLDRDTKEEPVVCRIFSSREAPPETNGKASGKSFFDMLGSGTMQTSQNTSSTSVASSLLGVDLMTPGLPTSSSASSMMTSPDFTTTTDGSFLTPSLPTTPTPTGEEILHSQSLYES